MKTLLALIALALFSSCAAETRVTFVRRDKTLAVKGDSFKERW